MWSEQQIGAGPSFIHNYTHTYFLALLLATESPRQKCASELFSSIYKKQRTNPCWGHWSTCIDSLTGTKKSHLLIRSLMWHWKEKCFEEAGNCSKPNINSNSAWMSSLLSPSLILAAAHGNSKISLFPLTQYNSAPPSPKCERISAVLK